MTSAIDPSTRAILRAVAGTDATEVTADQAKKAADGLVGHLKDGVVDKVEAAALVQASRWSFAATSTSAGLAKLLATGQGSIPIEAGSRTPARFPDYIKVDSLSIAADMDDPPHVLLRDANGHKMAVWLAEHGAINAAFARKDANTHDSTPITLNPAEIETLALQMSRSLLNRLAAKPKPAPHPALLYARAATAATIPAAADEQDLSRVAMVPWLTTTSSDARTTVMQLDDQTSARFAITPTDFTVSYRIADGAWSAARHLTTGEVATLAMSREISDATDNLYISAGIEQMFLKAIWAQATNSGGD